MMARRLLRSSLVWCDTNSFHDFATRILTLSDGASLLCFPAIEGYVPFEEPWVLRNHSAVFVRPLGSAGRGGVGLYGYGEPNNAHSACKSIELFKAQADVEIAGEKANEIPIGRRPGNAEKGKDHSDSTGTQ